MHAATDIPRRPDGTHPRWSPLHPSTLGRTVRAIRDEHPWLTLPELTAAAEHATGVRLSPDVVARLLEGRA